MIYDLFELKSYYKDLITTHSLAFILTTLIFHMVVVLICIIKNNRDRWRFAEKTSTNTVHSLMWLLIILMIPYLGAAAYIGGSFVPFILWRSKNRSETEFKYSYKLRKRQTAIIVGGAVLGAVAGSILQFRVRWITYSDVVLALSLNLWFLLILEDWLHTVFNKKVFFRIAKTDSANAVSDMDTLIEFKKGKKIFGYGHTAELHSDIIPRFYGVESLAARYAADAMFPQTDGVPRGLLGNVYVSGQMYRYDGYFNGESIDTIMADVVDSAYIGRGVTCFLVRKWQAVSNQKKKCTDIRIYQCGPRIRYFLIRAGILTVIMLALSTPLFYKLHTGIISLIDKIF